jgi:hypothetical protein
MYKEPYIKSIAYLHENRPSQRQLKITLSNGTIVRAEACYESWEQWGTTTDELFITMPIVEKHNGWLHGGNRP